MFWQLVQQLASARFDAAESNYVVDSTNLTSLHKVIEEGLVATLKSQGQQGNPPLGV
jgi:hypothetical protein